MKISLLFSVITVAATVLACSFVGQAADSPDLVTSGTVRVEDANGSPLTGVHAHQEGDKLVVWGMFSTSPLPGHVDVTVLTLDRKVIAEAEVVPTVVTRIHKRLRWRFQAELPVTSPEGAIVKIGYGFGQHTAARTGASDETGK